MWHSRRTLWGSFDYPSDFQFCQISGVAELVFTEFPANNVAVIQGKFLFGSGSATVRSPIDKTRYKSWTFGKSSRRPISIMVRAREIGVGENRYVSWTFRACSLYFQSSARYCQLKG
jgi:hypothetical protein